MGAVGVLSGQTHSKAEETSQGISGHHRIAPSLLQCELRPLGEVIGSALVSLGVERAYGVMGGGVARLASGIGTGGVALVHMRHESSAAFAACEEFHTTGRPAAIWVTTGPGFVNALNGLTAIGWEGAKALLFAGATAGSIRPGLGFQDTRDSYLNALRKLAAPHVELAVGLLRTPADLYRLLDEWSVGLARPGAFIGAALVPLELQQRTLAPWVPRDTGPKHASATLRSDAYSRIAEDLSKGTSVIWTGFGARDAAASVGELASRLDARVVSSPRAKGTFPESDPRYLGVTGHGGDGRVLEFLNHRGMDSLLILGTRLHELTSFREPLFTPRRTLIHVDCDRSALANDFLTVPHLAVQQDVGSFLSRLLACLPPGQRSPSTPLRQPAAELRHGAQSRGIHPLDLMAVIQSDVVEASGITVMTDVGIAWSWAPSTLRFDSPRYRTSTTWGSMCHFATGILGAVMARGEPAVCVTGDGSMLMQSEVSTAVAYGAPAKWIVLNNGGYGTIHHGLAAINLPPMAVQIPPTRFDAWARSQGAMGLRAETPSELSQALRIAMQAPGPVVVDTVIDPTVPPPMGQRNAALLVQQETWRT